MDALKKLFILMPGKKETGKLILALLFYVYVPFLASGLVGGILAITVILAPVAALVSFVCNVYAVVGVVKAILAYMDKDLNSLCCKGE